MKLRELQTRTLPPAPWSEADNIPWHEPGFSERMLSEHLNPHHDRASRRTERIDRHVDWLHTEILLGVPSRVLDLGCGPGLYTRRLAERGHTCVGIDFSPAAIAHACREAGGVPGARYLEADIRTADYGAGFDLCTFIFGEFNSLRPRDARIVLARAHEAVAPGGTLLFEVHLLEKVREIGTGSSRWFTAESGLFSDRPHLVLLECFWDPDEKAATERYFVCDLESGDLTRYTTSTQGYTEAEYVELVRDAGFVEPDLLEGLGDAEGARADGLVALRATRR